MGFETPEEGYLAKIIVPSGTKNIPVGKLVCVIVTDEASVAAFKDYKDDGAAAPAAPAAAAPAPAQPAPAAPAPPAPAPVSQAFSAPPPAAAAGDRIYASPLAKRLAAEKGLSLQVRETVP